MFRLGPVSRTKQLFNFLFGRKLILYLLNVRVDFLIGQDNAGMLVPLEVRHGVDNELFATRTLYGWCLNGPVMTSKRSTAGICNLASNEADDRLDRLWEIDNHGNNTVKQSNSCDDMNEI